MEMASRRAAAVAAQRAWADAQKALALDADASNASDSGAGAEEVSIANGRHVVLCGLAERTELIGVYGIVRKFFPATQRYLVHTETDCRGRHVLAAPRHLVVLSTPSSDTSEVAAPSAGACGAVAADVSAEGEDDEAHRSRCRTRVFLCPGAQFSGTIAIPGADSGQRESYTLRILFDATESGTSGKVLCSHAAYGDEQVCDLEIVENSGTVEVRWSDAETACVGQVDFAHASISGTVTQLQYGEDGFYFPSNEITHTFRLVRSEDTPRVTALRARLNAAGLSRIVAWSQLGNQAHDWEPTEVDRVMVDSLDWCTLFEDALQLVERECCRLRRMACRLDSATYATSAVKSETLASWKAAGYTRHAAHSSTDEIRRHFDSVLHLLVRFHSITDQDNVVALNKLTLGMHTARMRLVRSFDRFDKALHSAEQRLPQEMLDSWRKRAPLADTCMICCTGIATDDLALELPCHHIFHEGCISTWLHRQASCPACRSALPDPEPSGA